MHHPRTLRMQCSARLGLTALRKKTETKALTAICPAPSAASRLLAMEEDDGTHLEPFATLIIISGPEPSVPAVPPLKPVAVIYCGSAFLSLFFFCLPSSPQVCGVPPEYCEYGPKETYEQCTAWQLKHCPELVPKLKEQAEKAEAERKAKAAEAAANGTVDPAAAEPAAAAKPKKKKKVCAIMQCTQQSE